MRIELGIPGEIFRPTGVTTEQLVLTGPVVLFGLYPELTTTGTITLRDGAAADGSGTTKHVCAIGLTQAGKNFGTRGLAFVNGLTIQLSVASDLTLVQYAKPGA